MSHIDDDIYILQNVLGTSMFNITHLCWNPRLLNWPISICYVSHSCAYKIVATSTIHIDLSHVTYWCWTSLVTSTAVHIDLSHVTYWCWTSLVTCTAVHVDCHVSLTEGEIRWLQPALLPLACSMPHSWNSFIAYPASTGMCNFIYWPTRCAVRGNSVTLNRKTVIAYERNSDWSQSDCIRAVSGSIDAYGLAEPNRWFAITYFICLNRPVLPLCPLFARASSFKSVLKSTRVTMNENFAPSFTTPSYLRVLVSM